MNGKVIVGIAGTVLKLGASTIAQNKLRQQATKELTNVDKNFVQFKAAGTLKQKAEIAADMVVATAKLGVVSAAQTGVNEYSKDNGRALTSRTKGELSALRRNIGGEEGSIQKALTGAFEEDRWN